MSRTVEIGREQWFDFLENLARRARDYPVTIEVDSHDLGEQEVATKAPLVGIELEKKGSEASDIEVVVTAGDGGMFEHHIDDPNRMYVLENDAGNIDCLEIETADGAKTLVYFEKLPGLPARTASSAEEAAPGP